jgi:nanoRNase/pAp phosphatase (c-di-AMP/oligoRNAs hydrolase)
VGKTQSFASLTRPGRKRPDRLLEVLKGASRVAVVTHDNPDPDAIASGWGLVFLIESILEIPAKVYAGGAVTRAENRAMVELLKPPLEIVEEFKPPAGTEVVVVDTVWPARLAGWPAGETLAAVIDHHAHEPSLDEERPFRLRFRFRDIRTRTVATSSLVASYLKDRGLVPAKELATAMLYGIHTDAKGWDVKFSRSDRTAIAWLSQFSDPGLRARIERAPLPRAYFTDLLLGLENCFSYEDCAICFLPSASGYEVVGEIADMLLRCQGVERVLCAAVVKDRMVLSARTGADAGNAAALLLKALAGEGSCGGHVHRAGGYVSLKPLPGGVEELQSRLRNRWLEACGIAQQRGTRLVAKKEILKALE